MLILRKRKRLVQQTYPIGALQLVLMLPGLVVTALIRIVAEHFWVLLATIPITLVVFSFVPKTSIKESVEQYHFFDRSYIGQLIAGLLLLVVIFSKIMRAFVNARKGRDIQRP